MSTPLILPPKFRQTKTEKVDAGLANIIAGEDVEPLIDSFSEDEKVLFYQLVDKIRSGEIDEPEIFDELWKVDYIRRPPTIEEYIEDEYWMGGTLKATADNPGLFPIWKETLTKDFDLDSRVHNIVVTGSLGIGKCHGKGTKVLLFNGIWKNVEDVQVGDELMGDDSTPRKVLSLARGTDEMFQIIPDRPLNDPGFTCNSAHILCLKDSIGTVIEISVRDYLNLIKNRPSNGITQKFKLYRTGVEYKHRTVEIDPYWLGLWLGDGCSHSASLTIAFKDSEILQYHKDYTNKLGLESDVVLSSIQDNCALFNMTKPTYLGVKENPIMTLLRKYGLSGKSDSPHRKFIPKDYLYNSSEVRKQLLAGLIDTDGGKYNEGCYGIAVANHELGYQIAELAGSLGYQVDVKVKQTRISKLNFIGDAVVVTISGANDLPVLLPRKKSKPRSINNRRSTSKTGFKIKPIGTGEYYGFTIDGNHRYIVQGWYVTHNTYIMCSMFLYRIVLATLLRAPQNFFGLSKGSSIIYSILSVSKQVVQETAFGDAMNFMANSPYFLEELNYDPDRKYANFNIPLGRNIFLTAGSKGQHIIGRNAMGVALDEGNWRLEANPDEKAYKLYDEVRTRISNRFQKTAGFLPAISILASSSKDESSFTEKVIEKIRDANRKGDENQKVYRYAIYQVKRGEGRHANKYKKEWFKVAHGLKNMEPYVMSGWYTEDGTPILPEIAKHEQPPPGALTELVPADYHDHFLRNCKTNLQSLSGISTGGSYLLFPNSIDLERSIEIGEKEGLKNPAKIELIPISMEDDKNVWDYLQHGTFLTKRNSTWQPIRHPTAPRFAHIDLATQSMAGVAVGHLVGRQLVEGLVNNLGQVFSEHRLIFEYDFILTIVAGKSKPISLEKIQNFFFWLRDICSYQFGLVTADQFQCLEGSTLVNTRRGLLPIKNVVVGDIVQSKSGPNPVTRVFKYVGKPTLKIVTDDGNVLEGTFNHKIEASKSEKRNYDYNWYRLDELEVGDIIRMSDEVNLDSNYVKLCPLTKSLLMLDKWTAPTVLSEDFAEWYGIVYGDGNISGNSVKISAHILEIEDAASICEKVFGKKPKIARCRTTECWGASIHSSYLVKWMKLNRLTKSEISPLILQSPKSVQAAFIRGLFSADGTVTKHGQVTFSTSQCHTATTVSTLLRTSFGIHSHIVKVRRAFCKGGELRDQWILQIRGSLKFYERIGFCYKTKQAKNTLATKGRNLVVRVKSIEKSINDVFDLSVKNDPSYTANGFVSHNSSMPLQMMEARGFKVAELSVDRKKAPYYGWRAAFQESRIRMYRQYQLMREAEQLVDGPDKVDHPKDGSKDTTDAAAGAYTNAINATELAAAVNHDNAPAIYTAKDAEEMAGEKPPIYIPLPEPKRRSAVFYG